MKRLLIHSCVFMASLILGCGDTGEPSQSGVPPVVQCTLLGCDDGALYTGKLSLNGADPTTLEVTVCVNGACETAPIQAVQAGVGNYSCSVGSRLRCTLSAPADGSAGNLSIVVAPPAGMDPLASLQDGDRYDVTFGAQGQTPLLKLGATAGYRVIKPNGSLCEPTCKQVTLTPSP
jgi:hypothetical protein